MKKIVTLLVGCLLAINAWAVSHKAEGTVNKVDKTNKTLNITHGPIKTMNMMGMTMNFIVADPAMLDDVKPGSKISFELEQDQKGRFVITDLEAQ